METVSANVVSAESRVALGYDATVKYPPTVGLRMRLRMTGTTTRPELAFAPDQSHPFALECRTGVTVQRVKQWLAAET